MFEGIGRIGSYVQQKDLSLQARTKITTGVSLKEQQRSLVRGLKDAISKTQQTKKTNTSLSGEAKKALIKQKLKQGRELSASDLKYLKENDEDLYSKAKKAQTARAELKRDLRSAKTKEEARAAVMRAQMKVAAEAQLDAKCGSASSVSGAMSNVGMNADAGLSAGISSADIGISAEGDVTAEVAIAMDGVDTSVEASMDVSSEADINMGTGNASVGEDTATGGSDVEAGSTEATGESSGRDDEAANGVEGSQSNDPTSQLEKYMFMLAAIRNEWAKFVKSKEYDELPDNYLPDSRDKAGKTETTAKQSYDDDKIVAQITALESYLQAGSAEETGTLLDTLSE